MNFFSTFSILLYLLAGLIIGSTFFPKKWLKINSKVITAGLSLVLFSMGATLGGSPTFFEDIATAGGQAAFFAAATVAGSVLVVWILSKIFLRGRS